jgi:hypothetical protein
MVDDVTLTVANAVTDAPADMDEVGLTNKLLRDDTDDDLLAVTDGNADNDHRNGFLQ